MRPAKVLKLKVLNWMTRHKTLAWISLCYQTRNEAPDKALIKPTRITDEVLSFPVGFYHNEVVAAHQRLVILPYLKSNLLKEDVEEANHEPAGN